MVHCQYCEQVDAYHDGQLDAVAAAKMRVHLAGCPDCAAALSDVENVSRVFAESTAPRLSQIGLRRLHAQVELLFDRGLVQLARVMTGLAAAVVVAGSVWLMHSSTPAPVAASVTQMALQIEEQPPTAPEPGPSDWIVAELSN